MLKGLVSCRVTGFSCSKVKDNALYMYCDGYKHLSRSFIDLILWLWVYKLLITQIYYGNLLRTERKCILWMDEKDVVYVTGYGIVHQFLLLASFFFSIIFYFYIRTEIWFYGRPFFAVGFFLVHLYILHFILIHSYFPLVIRW